MEVNDNSLRLSSLIDNLILELGEIDCGKILQILLAITFVRVGFKITSFQLTGEPDFIADSSDILNIEVKTTQNNKISVDDKILKSASTLAVMFIDPTDTKWIIADTKNLYKRTYSKFDFQRAQLRDLEQKINKIFINIFEENLKYAENGVDALYYEFKVRYLNK